MARNRESRQKETESGRDPWHGRDFGSFVKMPRLLSPAFLPDLTPKNYIVLMTLFAELMESHGKTGESSLKIKRSELRILSGLGSDAAVSAAIKGLKQAGHISADSKFPLINLSPLLDTIESLASKKKSANLTFLEMARPSRKLTKSVRKPDIGPDRKVNNIKEISASPAIYNTSSESGLTDEDIDWGGNAIRGTEKYWDECEKAADGAFKSIGM